MQTDPQSRKLSVEIDVPPHAPWKRVHLLVRALVWVALGMVHESGPSLFGLLYFFLPVVAAILIAQRGGTRYLESAAPGLVWLLEWVVGFYAYMLFVCDVFPLGKHERAVRLHVTPSGDPTAASALLRLVTSLPHLVVLVLVGIASVFVALIAALSVLLFETYPEAMRSFQRDFTGRLARLLAYHASLVATFPSPVDPSHAEPTQSSATESA